MNRVEELEVIPELKQKYDKVIKFIVEEKCPSPLILQRKFKITFKLADLLMKTHSIITSRPYSTV